MDQSLYLPVILGTSRQGRMSVHVAQLVVARELGLAVTFTDVYVGRVHDVFGADGRLLEPAFVGRVEEFLRELVWMATTLRWGRRNISVEDEEEATPPLACPACGAAMNHHANKLAEPRRAKEAARVDPALGGRLEEAHTCPECGAGALRRVDEARLAPAPAAPDRIG